MADIYKVDYTIVNKVGSQGPNQIRQTTEQKMVFVAATSVANAIAAMKTAEPRNGNALLEYSNIQVHSFLPGVVIGS